MAVQRVKATDECRKLFHLYSDGKITEKQLQEEVRRIEKGQGVLALDNNETDDNTITTAA